MYQQTKTYLFLLLFLAFFFVGNTQDNCVYTNHSSTMAELIDCHCENANNTLEINECMSAVVKSMEAEMDRVCEQIKKSLKEDDLIDEIEFLERAIEAWKSYTDAQAKLIYQQYIDGTIRGQMALGSRMGNILDFTSKIRRQYRDCFYQDFTQEDLVGIWVNVKDPKDIFTFEIKDNNYMASRKDGEKLLWSGDYAFNEEFFLMVDGGEGYVLEEWFFLENIDLGDGREDVHLLSFLSGAGSVRTAYVKQ